MPKDLPERANDAEAVISALHDMDDGLVVSDWELAPDGPHVSRLTLTVGIYHNKVDFQMGDGESDDPQLKPRDPISDGAFRELLKLYKQTNAWPVDDAKNRLMIVQFLDAEAAKREYDHWEQAYDALIAGDVDE